MLLNKKSIYPEFVDRNKIVRYVSDHMQRKRDLHHELCLALTFELWLQQVFEGKYREGMPESTGVTM
jgi:asparagine synthase (glutamine-hydrolysing)